MHFAPSINATEKDNREVRGKGGEAEKTSQVSTLKNDRDINQQKASHL